MLGGGVQFDRPVAKTLAASFDLYSISLICSVANFIYTFPFAKRLW